MSRLFSHLAIFQAYTFLACNTLSVELQEVESDETLTDLGINLGVFRFLTDSVVASDNFHNEEIYVRKLHQLVTSYIVNMQIKVHRGD